MLTVDDYAKIRLAHRDGMSIREIARTFKHSRRKVREVLANPQPQPYTRRKPPAAPRTSREYRSWTAFLGIGQGRHNPPRTCRGDRAAVQIPRILVQNPCKSLSGSQAIQYGWIAMPKILVVDDDSHIRDVIRFALARVPTCAGPVHAGVVRHGSTSRHHQSAGEHDGRSGHPAAAGGRRSAASCRGSGRWPSGSPPRPRSSCGWRSPRRCTACPRR